jgi:DnaJ-class molecular chaperone
MSAIKKDYYSVLGIIDCTEVAIIKAVYKALMMIYHPDRYAGNKDEAVRKSKEINEAYAVLIDPDKRKKYDAQRNLSPLASATAKSTSHAIELARQTCIDHYEKILAEKHRDYEKILAERHCDYENILAEKHRDYENILAERHCDYENILAETHRDYELKMNVLKTSISFKEVALNEKDKAFSGKEADLVMAKVEIKRLKKSVRQYADELTALLEIIKDESP